MIKYNEVEIDKHIGHKIFEYRKTQGISIQTLAKRIGVSQQQCYKYEAGRNKVSASRLMSLANILGVAVSDFYEDLGKNSYLNNVTDKNLYFELSSYFMKIQNPRDRSIIKSLVKSLVKQEPSNVA